jgi:DNA modification methylase
VSHPINVIHHGLCLDVLRTYPDNFFDSIVMDPPYGLGRDPRPEEIIAYLQGDDLSLGEFMERDWELPSVAVWKECYRVLKSGGFLLSFAGTRTLDILSIGIRVSGFDNRDCIPVEMGPPILRWIRAQGMPKSVDISKALDKKFGADREVLGENPNLRPAHKHGSGGFDKLSNRASLTSMPLTSPTTDLAKKWFGWGSALKPYWEPILMFRKPIKEDTLVDQILSTGTGGINIEASRVKHSSLEDFAKHKAGVDSIKLRGGKMGNSWKNSSDLSGANEVTTSGRFPPNLILVHSDLCKKVGVKQIPMPPINRFDDGAKPFGGGAGHEYTTIHREDEVIDIWECHSSCPVSLINQQHSVADCGASRYFMNIDPDSLFFYVPKPNAREKNNGLDEGDENLHVSVKPVKLMEYLVQMVTPAKGIVLDPFCGSGTTCVAAINKGFHFVGIDKEAPSVKTARARVQAALQARQEADAEDEMANLVFDLESE